MTNKREKRKDEEFERNRINESERVKKVGENLKRREKNSKGPKKP